MGMTDKLAETGVNYNNAEIDWREVGFFTIDGTAFSQVKSYYIHYETWYSDRYYYLEMENGAGTGVSELSVNTPVDGTIIENEVIDAYQVNLDSTKYYDISLDVPTGVTFDLFLCYAISDEESAIASSHSDELGVEEKIESFQPDSSGYYCIVVTNPESTQSGDYILKVQESGAVPTTSKDTTTAPTKTSPTESSQPSGNGTSYPGLVFTILPFLLILTILQRKHKN